MSKVALSGNASGTGTFTIASPNGSTDRTITLPDSNGTILTTATAGVPVNGPAFNAYLGSNQSITSQVTTKLQINTELFDTNGCFNNTGSTVDGIPAYAFRPNIAGYYHFSFSVYPFSLTSVSGIRFYKNGADAAYIDSVGNSASASGSIVLYMNGSTDYVELYGYLNGAAPVMFGRKDLTFLSGALIRSAT